MHLRSTVPHIAHVVVALALAVGVEATAQLVPPSQSAADDAARRSGVVASRIGGRLVARALYVGRRVDASQTDVLEHARRVGLRPVHATGFGLVTGHTRARLNDALHSLPSARRARVERLAQELWRVTELEYAADVHPEDAARMMMTSATVEYAEPVPVDGVDGSVFIPNDPLVGDQPHLARIKAFEAWDVWPGDSNTVIGIVDAGIDNTHEDLVPNIAENRGEEGLDASGNDKRTNRIDDDLNGVADDWRGANLNAPGDGSVPGDTRAVQHGTAVAGAAAAATNNAIGIAGVANRCQFFPVKTMPRSGGPLTKSYNGIEYCAMRGFKVVNCSFGGPDFSRTRQTLITFLIERYDIAIVASAGNDPLYDVRYPAGYRGVLGVGAVDNSDGFATTFGEQVDVSAPVGWLTVDSNRYAPGLIATSFSSPVAAGVVALARSRWPALDAVQALAHVRLTSDTITSDGERTRLTGYGIVNALRAVSEDPMSRPGIIVDTLWLTDESGAVQETFGVGERGLVHMRLRNLLGSATNVRARLVDFRDAGESFAIDSAFYDVGAIGTGDTVTLSVGIPFRLVRPDTGRMRLRIELTADGNYFDYDFAAPFVYLDRPSIAVYATSEIALSVSSRGNIGFADYPTNEYGVGVQYDQKSFLFEGGFIAATAPTRVVNNVRGADGTAQDRDFVALELPSNANAHTLTLVDAGASQANEVGLELRVRTLVSNEVPNAFALHVRARNINAATADSLRLGLFADWDLAGEGDGQMIETFESAGASVPLYAVVSGEGYHVATGAIAHDSHPILYAIDNAGELNLYQNFNHAKKWHTLSNGIGARSVGPADVSIVTGRVLTNLERDQEDTVLFVTGIGRSSSEAVAAMQAIAAVRTSAVASTARVATMLGAPRPNPASLIVRVDVALRSDGRLVLYDALGRMVADLTHMVPAGGVGSVSVDASSLETGMYVLRASDNRGSVSAPLIVQ